MERKSFWKQSDSFVNELVECLSGKRVLEVFAGNGLAAKLLHDKGIQITATSLKSSMFDPKKNHFDVMDVEASDAAFLYRDHDIMLMMWSDYSADALLSYLNFIPDFDNPKQIIFVGELTDEKSGTYGGCACQEFFSLTDKVMNFESYNGGMYEIAEVRILKTKDQVKEIISSMDFKYFFSKFCSVNNSSDALTRLIKWIKS